MKPIFVTVRFADGEEERCAVRVTFTGQNEARLLVEGRRFGRAEADGYCAFHALMALRERLDPTGLRFLCEGARPDVYPSAMASDAGGFRAYRRPLDGSRTVMVEVFAPAPAEAVGTVEEQNAFLAAWASRPRQAGSALRSSIIR